MKLSFIYGPMCLSFRGSLDFEGIMDDPRGLTGSEYGIIRTAEECAKMGYEVTLHTISSDKEYNGVKIARYDTADQALCSRIEDADAHISWNEPDTLRGLKGLLVCEQMLNSFEYCREKPEHVDLWTSPSEAHREYITNKPQSVNGYHNTWTPDPSKWRVNSLGCDPEAFDMSIPKVPGRCIYCSSPDRGLHILLQEWPKIKKAVPHASLRIFYRLAPLIQSFEKTPYFPPVEENRQRINYIDHAIRRLKHLDVEVFDSVSRNRLAREMREAEVLAYPCNTLRWSEGFSCSVLESMTAGCVPVITDCDALGSIYKGHGPAVVSSGCWSTWSDEVIGMLSNRMDRAISSGYCRAFAEGMTWASHAERLVKLIEERI